MSHFCVMVISEDIDEQLAPFQENNMGDCPAGFLEFNDEEDEMRREYADDTVDRIVEADGKSYFTWDVRYKINTEEPFRNEIKYLEDSEKKPIPMNEIYATFEEFAKGWHGREEPDEKTGRYGYWENPNAKWDWFELGGRWTGYFKLKPVLLLDGDGLDLTELGFTQAEFLSLVDLYEKDRDKFDRVTIKYSGKTELIKAAVLNHLNPVLPEHRLGRPGVMMSEAKRGYADQLFKKDIDLAGMYLEAIEKGLESFDKYLQVTAGIAPPIPWGEFRETFFKDIDKAREAWAKHPFNIIMAEHKLSMFMGDDHQYYRIGQKNARDLFIEDCRCRAITPFAFLKDGKWCEKGEMGWFGCVSDEKLQYDWSAQFRAMFEELPGDTLISIVDCHI